jgi:zinc transport system substrate-binding protein
MIAILKEWYPRSHLVTRIALILIGLAAAAGAAGCGGSSGSGGREQVVAAFYPLAFAAEQVAGEGVEVRDLTPAGAEPHDLELSAGDVRRLLDADLVVYLGEGFQPALERALRDRDGPSLDLLAGQELLEAEEHAGEARSDPHVWLDPRRFAAMAERIAAALGGGASARSLVGRLDELDRELERGLADCERRELVTSHAAFGYLAERYGLEQIALSGVSPEAEPSPRALAALVAEVRRSGATTVFFETLVSPRLAQTVAREAGARAAVLDPLEGLTAKELEAGSDYFSVMRENLAALRTALGCR